MISIPLWKKVKRRKKLKIKKVGKMRKNSRRKSMKAKYRVKNSL
jgi:hypothetical protein